MRPSVLKENTKLVALGLFVLLISTSVSATEIESGYFTADSTGIHSESLGFRPDYIEFITAQQIEDADFHENDPTNNDCPDNVNGWSEGSVVFDSSGVDKQFSIGMFRNSDSTNGHRTASSTSDVIKNIYSGQDGYQCGKLEISVVQPLSAGFEVDVESTNSQYNEIVRYKAYQFPDNMEFDAGMKKITSTGDTNVDLGFQPANLHIRAGQQISSKNSNNRYWRDPMGRSKGYATLDNSGNVIDQQSIGTASSSDSTNAHRSLASDEHVLNTVYVDQNANVQGRLEGKITGADSNGFTMDVETKSYSSDEVFLYRAWGFSYYDFDIGYKVIDNQGTQSFNTGFQPDAIDIYAEQQISSINNEVVTPGNSGCDNAGGWSNGFYETDDNRQWAISTGRTSDSQNSHRYGSTTSEALRNLYSGQNGGNCGEFEGDVIGTSNSGFTMDFNYRDGFDSNYDREMVYYRAFNFQLAPPKVNELGFTNSTEEHQFTVTANISEGSNDIDECEFDAWSQGDGNHHTYTNSSRKLNSTHSQCIQTITYNDDSDWLATHKNDDQLLTLNTNVTAKDVDGQSSYKVGINTFPNHQPSVSSILYSNYTQKHAFNVTAELADVDAKNNNEIRSCTLEFSDGDGNTVTKYVDIDYSFGTYDQAKCRYSNVNSSISGFEVLEEIDTRVSISDIHGNTAVSTDSHEIPNQPPYSFNPDPRDGGYTAEYPVPLSATVNDEEGDVMDVEIFNEVTGQKIYSENDLTIGERFNYDWEVPDATTSENYWTVQISDPWSSRNITYTFTKTLESTYRTQMSINLNYSSITLNSGSDRYTQLILENNVRNDKDITIDLNGVKAEFLDGATTKTLSNFEGGEKRKFTLRITPDNPVTGELIVEVENNELGVKTRESIPVTATPVSTEANEVPGIGVIQLLFLVSAATVLYSVRL